MIWPLPDIDREPAAYPEMLLGATTVLLEAGGESDQGKLGVAWVIQRRMQQRRQSMRQVILAPWQFSCWLPTEAGWRRARLQGIDPVTWDACWWSICGAHWDLLPDPTAGADHYLNPEATRAARPLHDLPDWYDADKVTWREGRHEFLRLA